MKQTDHAMRRNCLLKHLIEWKKGWKHEEEDISSYWMTLRKRKDSGNLKRKHYMVMCEEIALEEAMKFP
jgi:hypothetical protein